MLINTFSCYFSFLQLTGIHITIATIFLVVNPVDDQAPTVKYLAKKVEVLERGIKILTKEIISGTDEDTDDESLTFLIVSGPLHGAIEKQGRSLTYLQPCLYARMLHSVHGLVFQNRSFYSHLSSSFLLLCFFSYVFWFSHICAYVGAFSSTFLFFLFNSHQLPFYYSESS